LFHDTAGYHAILLARLWIDGEVELGRDHNADAGRPQGLADNLLIGERAIDLGSIANGSRVGCRIVPVWIPPVNARAAR